MKSESGDGSFLPPSLHLKLDLADGLQKLCEWGNFLLCLQIFNKVTTSSALSHSDNLLLDFFYICAASQDWLLLIQMCRHLLCFLLLTFKKNVPPHEISSLCINFVHGMCDI